MKSSRVCADCKRPTRIPQIERQLDVGWIAIGGVHDADSPAMGFPLQGPALFDQDIRVGRVFTGRRASDIGHVGNKHLHGIDLSQNGFHNRRLAGLALGVAVDNKRIAGSILNILVPPDRAASTFERRMEKISANGRRGVELP